MNDKTLEFITKRRSIRSFTGEPVPREALVTILKAAMAAPNRLFPRRLGVNRLQRKRNLD